MYSLRLCLPQIRKFTTNANLNKQSHYDSLGITSKATQADVKSAYYKLSMQYHPDKNKNSSEAADKFRDISAAYEVLGNVKSRKLYDRGLYFRSDTTPVHHDTPIDKFHKSRDVKSRVASPYGRTTVYDFDEWSRAHYGATFRMDMKFKQKKRMDKIKEEQLAKDAKTERMLLLIAFMGMCFAYIFHSKDQRHDTVSFGEFIVTTSKSKD